MACSRISFREMVDYTNNQVEQDFMRRWRFCSILVFHVCDMLSSRLSLDIYALFKMVLDCLWVVVEIFEVVVGGFRSFHVLVLTDAL